jgi:hypothetical protein
MVMPYKFAQQFNGFYMLTVQFSQNMGTPVIREDTHFFMNINFLNGSSGHRHVYIVQKRRASVLVFTKSFFRGLLAVLLAAKT